MENRVPRTLIVAGGGAAGFFCAVNAARMNPHLRVIILEQSTKLLSKVKISGGGRCNVTHACFSVSQLCKKYPRGGPFLKKTFHQFNPRDTINWFGERKVHLKTEADGRMFPDTDDAQTIIDCLLREARKHDVEIRLQSRITSFSREADRFEIRLADHTVLLADDLVIACGGYPKASMFDWLRSSGHSIEPPVPSLFTFNTPGHPLTRLMGLSVADAVIKITGTKLEERGPILCTHWGLSGPGILRLSAWGARILAAQNWRFKIRINWLPDKHEESLREAIQQIRAQKGKQLVHHKNPFGLPARLWTLLLEMSEVPEACKWAELPARAQHLLILNCCSLELQITGKTTFKEEFVTAGGIHLAEVAPQTMMSRLIPNLYFAGEILDIDGITGGFNFQHAWTSGYIAATNIASSHVAPAIST